MSDLKKETLSLKKETLANNIQNSLQNVVIELNNEWSVWSKKKEKLSLKKETLANNNQNSAKYLELKNEVSGLKPLKHWNFHTGDKVQK